MNRGRYTVVLRLANVTAQVATMLGVALCSTASWCVEPNIDVVRTIVRSELAAMRLPLPTPFCLTFLPVTNYQSKTEGDPSPELLKQLKVDGFRPRPGSVCIETNRGYAIDIYTDKLATDNPVLKVTFGDNTPVAEGEDMGILHHSGIYEFVKTSQGAWRVLSYTSEVSDPPVNVNSRRSIRRQRSCE